MRVMIVGATGVFGSRLAEQLALSGFDDLVLAGRDEGRAATLLDRLHGRGVACRFARFDRRHPDRQLLRELSIEAVVDAAGPFQTSDLALPRACIAAGAHYIDLADSRDFVAHVPSLDGAAREAGVCLVTGASSTPALSHAVIDHLAAGWKRIDAILVAISPGNRAPRGLSVVQAILSYAGRPVRVFREGHWSSRAGWSLNQTIEIAGVGRRDVVLCETPDLDLMMARYAPLVAAEFKAGVELGILHHGLRLASVLVRSGLMRSLAGMARPARTFAALLKPFGGDAGGMMVRILGRDAQDRPRRVIWSLAAQAGRGPTVPTLPAVALLHSLKAWRVAI